MTSWESSASSPSGIVTAWAAVAGVGSGHCFVAVGGKLCGVVPPQRPTLLRAYSAAARLAVDLLIVGWSLRQWLSRGVLD